MCEVAVEGFTLGLLAAGSPAATPQADGDVGGVAVAVVGRYVGSWGGLAESIYSPTTSAHLSELSFILLTYFLCLTDGIIIFLNPWLVLR